MSRKIIHCDCDCFYASIEMRDKPSLRDKPLAVGGQPDRRGVVATCNYEARRYGIHSAMPMSQAVRRCPELQIIAPAMDKYKQASRQILAIYRHYTSLVEPLSLDEAYLDVSDAPFQRGSATLIAQEIRSRIKSEIGITVSAGVAPNKFLAKIASDWNKPDGLHVILPQQVDEFVAALPVARIFGVGKVTAAKLQKLGVDTCADLRHWSLPQLQQQFGKFGNKLYMLCRGIDEREVSIDQERKSVSVEETYVQDLPDTAACLKELPQLYTSLQRRAGACDALSAVHKLYVKLRFSDFRVTTAECLAGELDIQVFQRLLETAHARRGLPVRLIGLGIRLAEHGSEQQLGLF